MSIKVLNGLDLTNQKLVNLATPTNASDAVNKSYADLLGGGGGSTIKTAIIRDIKSGGTNGGTFNAGAWRTRDLVTISQDSIGLSLSSNQFTLPAGKYVIIAMCPAYRVDYHKCQIYNVSDGVVVQEGSSEFSTSAGSDQTSSFVAGYVDISSSKTFRIEHRCTTSASSYGFGLRSLFGTEEVYTIVFVLKAA